MHCISCAAVPVGLTELLGQGPKAAVRKYQERHGLTVDGQVGDATWNSLTGEIKIIQRALSQKGYYSGYIDGVAGEGTYNAVIQFQTASGLAVDGQVGDATRAKLMGSGFPQQRIRFRFSVKNKVPLETMYFTSSMVYISCVAALVELMASSARYCFCSHEIPE